MVTDNIGFLGMKGAIDLRVADILAKQASLQHKGALFQSHIAQHESDRAALYTARAEAVEKADEAGQYDADDPLSTPLGDFSTPLPSPWYAPSEWSVLGGGRSLPTGVHIPPPMMDTFAPNALTGLVGLGSFRCSFSQFI
jgi:hypothetical protein